MSDKQIQFREGEQLSARKLQELARQAAKNSVGVRQFNGLARGGRTEMFDMCRGIVATDGYDAVRKVAEVNTLFNIPEYARDPNSETSTIFAFDLFEQEPDPTDAVILIHEIGIYDDTLTTNTYGRLDWWIFPTAAASRPGEFFALLAPTNLAGDTVSWPAGSNCMVVPGRTAAQDPIGDTPGGLAAGTNGAGHRWVSIYKQNEGTGAYELFAVDQSLDNHSLNPIYSHEYRPKFVRVRASSRGTANLWEIQDHVDFEWFALADTAQGPHTGDDRAITASILHNQRVYVQTNGARVWEPAVDQAGANVQISVNFRYKEQVEANRLMNGIWKNGEALFEGIDCEDITIYSA